MASGGEHWFDDFTMGCGYPLNWSEVLKDTNAIHSVSDEPIAKR
jgi:hypothetical protein